MCLCCYHLPLPHHWTGGTIKNYDKYIYIVMLLAQQDNHSKLM